MLTPPLLLPGSGLPGLGVRDGGLGEWVFEVLHCCLVMLRTKVGFSSISQAKRICLESEKSTYVRVEGGRVHRSGGEGPGGGVFCVLVLCSSVSLYITWTISLPSPAEVGVAWPRQNVTDPWPLSRKNCIAYFTLQPAHIYRTTLTRAGVSVLFSRRLSITISFI